MLDMTKNHRSGRMQRPCFSQDKAFSWPFDRPTGTILVSLEKKGAFWPLIRGIPSLFRPVSSLLLPFRSAIN